MRIKLLSTTVTLVVLILFVSFTDIYCEQDKTAPVVISTSPQNGAQNVDPNLTVISVTFSEPMMDKSWSWCYEDKSKFPLIIGQPKYSDNFTRNEIIVKLEPQKEYVIWINTSKIKNFKDKAGNPAIPYKLTFKTGGQPEYK